MSTTFGIPIRELTSEDVILDSNGELKDYVSESFFTPVFFRTYKNSRWINDIARTLPNPTLIYALDNSAQGIYTIGDCKKLLKDETNQVHHSMGSK